MNLATLQNLPQCLLIHTQVIPRRCLDILVPRQFLDERNVGSGVEERGTEGVPQQVWRDLFADASTDAQLAKDFRHFVATQPARCCSCGDEQRWMRVRA